MKTPLALVVAVALVAPLTVAAPLEARVIEKACLKSDRQAKSRALCKCIQTVADFSLSKGEQRKGAKFFKDPQRAQDTRQSDNPSNEVFWQKWKAFGASATQYCS